MRYIAIAFVFLFVSCAPIEPSLYKYDSLGITLVCADPHSIDQSCRSENQKTDLGQPYPHLDLSYPDNDGITRVYQVLIPACFKVDDREIWMQAGDFCDTLSHELCHANGQDPADCARHYPRIRE